VINLVKLVIRRNHLPFMDSMEESLIAFLQTVADTFDPLLNIIIIQRDRHFLSETSDYGYLLLVLFGPAPGYNNS
jgi:hypothetical protein